MEELTLDGKIFISSKRAAQITGYAKDYVGQLCREGRVEARSVGRNWYILESSIREHRFGAEKVTPIAELEPETDDIKDTWKASSYAAEPVSSLLTVQKAEVESVPVPHEEPVLAPEHASINEFTKLPPEKTYFNSIPATSPVVQEMQSAWHDWFKITNELEVSEEILIENPPALAELENTQPEEAPVAVNLIRNETIKEENTSEYHYIARKEQEVSDEDWITPVRLEKAATQADTREVENRSRYSQEESFNPEELVSIKRTFATPIAPLPSRSGRSWEDVQNEDIPTGRVIRERRVRTQKRRPSIIVSILFFLVAVIAIITGIGSGKLTPYIGSKFLTTKPLEYLGGQSSFLKTQ
jgi:hypothetical protein